MTQQAGPQPFEIHVPDRDLDELRDRLARTRWSPVLDDAGWDYGTDQRCLHELCEHWRTQYDWRAAEARLNALPMITHEVDGVALHVVHVRCGVPGAVPVLMVHGWPGGAARPARGRLLARAGHPSGLGHRRPERLPRRAGGLDHREVPGVG